MPKHIVAIDDDPHVLELLRAVLTDEGYHATTYAQGEGAIEDMREARPDAVILDVRMESPEAGWQVLERLTQAPTLRDLPIIICSADLTQLRQRWTELHDAGYEILPKPFDLDDLLNLLQRRVGGP